MLSAFGILWIAIESISFFIPYLRLDGWIWYCVFVLVAVAWGVYSAWPKKQIEIQIPGSDSSLKIKFGDIFNSNEIIVIPVNEYFDGKLGDHVSMNSIHGQFINNILDGDSENFLDLTSIALRNVQAKEKNVIRPSGQCDRYEIGTVVPIDIKNHPRYLLVVLSHTKLRSLKAFATVHDLWICLAGVWKGVREYSNGQPVGIPLIGSGLSGIGLPPANLISILLTSFLYHTKERKIADRVTLVLPRRLKKSIDLKTIKRGWT